jgi:hypothetical protein
MGLGDGEGEVNGEATGEAVDVAAAWGPCEQALKTMSRKRA